METIRKPARTWQGIRTPQGITGSALLVLAGPTLEWFFHRGEPSTVEQLVNSPLLLAIPVVLFWAILGLYYFIQVWLGPQRLSFAGRPKVVYQANGWRLLIVETPSGITFASGLVNDSDGWPADTQWEGIGRAGKAHVAVVRANIPPVQEMIVVPWTSRTWPVIFA